MTSFFLKVSGVPQQKVIKLVKGRYAIAELTSVPCQVLCTVTPSSPSTGPVQNTTASLKDLPDKERGRWDLSTCYLLWVTRFREFPTLTQKRLAKLAHYSICPPTANQLLQQPKLLLGCKTRIMWATILALIFCWLQNTLYAVAFLWSTFFGLLCQIRARWRLLFTQKPSWHRH